MKLFDRLEVYGRSSEVCSIQEGYQAALDELAESAHDMLGQLFVDTATWAIPLWEQYLGIASNAQLKTSVRREAIKAKLRGAGTTTVAMIENVAESYVNGEVMVTENNPQYAFAITFLSTRGKPAGFDSLKAAIEEIKPAHLAVAYVFTYTTHEELEPYTHGGLTPYTHEQIRALEVT